MICNIFLFIMYVDGFNFEIELDNLYFGIFIYWFVEGFSYLNVGNSLEYLVEYIFVYIWWMNLVYFDWFGDWFWNEFGLLRKDMKVVVVVGVDVGIMVVDVSLLMFKVVILDFSLVNYVDIILV